MTPDTSLVEDQALQVDPDEFRRRRAAATPKRRRAAAQSGATSAPVPGAMAHLHEIAFVTRESAEYGFLLMEKMIQQTLDAHRAVPGVEEAIAIGAAVLRGDREGERIREDLQAQLLYSRAKGGSRWFGVRFEISGTPFQWGLTSGAKTALDGDNDWVESLCEFIDITRPAQLVTGPASRLARLARLFGDIERSAQATRSRVCTAEIPGGMDLTDLGGRASFSALANAAELDYRATIMRLVTGVVFELKNNRYPRAGTTLYPGYERRGGKGEDRNDVLIADSPATRKLVRRFIELAAGDARESDIATELSALGLTSRWAAAPDVPADEVDNPATLITRLFQSLPTYLDGKYLFRHEVPLPNMDDIHGIPIHRAHVHDSGYFEFVLDFGLPDGGWHDPALIEQAIRKRLSETPTPAASPRTTVKPLAGLVRYDEGAFEYVLLSNERETYELRRRELPAAETRRPTFHQTDGDLVGRFAAIDVHCALAKVLAGLADGIPVVNTCPEQAREARKETAGIDAQIARLTKERDHARREAIAADDDDSAEYYRQAVIVASSALAAATRTRSLSAASARRAPATALDGKRIAALIRILEGLDGPAPAYVQHTLRSVLRKVTFGAVETATPMVEMRVVVALRTDVGVAVSEPQRAYVRNGAVGAAPGQRRSRGGSRLRNRAILEMLLLESVSEAERRALWDAEQLDGRSFQRRMAEFLAPLTGPAVASAIIDCPILDVRRAALRPYLDHDLPLSAAFSPELEDEVAAVYARRGFQWTNGWCPGGMARERQILGFIDKYANDPELGLPLNTLCSTLQLSDRAIHRMAHTGPVPYGRRNPSAAAWYARIELHQAQSDDDRRKRTYVRIRECPHCGNRTMLQPLRVPEVAGYLLCTDPGCRRALRSGTAYPDAFFEPWDGPQSLPRRQPGLGKAGKRAWWTDGGRVIVGTSRAELDIPSLHAPRTAQ